MSIVALEGLRPWVLQRLTAVYLVVYTIYAIIFWTFFETLNFTNWRQWVADDLNLILLSLFYISIFVHAWVGIRDILLDYIKPFLIRLFLLFTVAVFLIGSGIWMIRILIMVNT